MISLDSNINSINNDINYVKICNEFCKYYYKNMSENGIHYILKLFHPNVSCSINNQEFKGGYNLLIFLTNQGIKKFNYYGLKGFFQPISRTELIIYVHGSIRPVNLWNETNEWKKFSEIFIIQENGLNKYVIKNYIFHIIK